MALNRLKASRLERGLTQDETAQALGIVRGTYESIENKRRVPWPKFRREAAAFFGKSDGWLFGKQRSVNK